MRKTTPEYALESRISSSKALPELASPEFKLLIGLTITAIIEAISYAWIEVLLYTSTSPVLYNNWILGHYNSYHVVLAFLVLSMIFGVGFVAWLTYSPTRFRKFFLLTLGDFLLWIMLEDEFTFIFSGATHTATDWTNWPIGSIHIFGNYVPLWYILASLSIFLLWFYGLYSEDSSFSSTRNSSMNFGNRLRRFLGRETSI